MDKKYDSFFDRLYIDHYKNLLKYAYRLTYERNFSEEIVQDAFAEACKKIDLLYKHENPVGWLYIAVKNISKSYLREISRMKNRLPLEDYDVPVTDEEDEAMMLLSDLTKAETDIILRFYKYKQTLSEISNEYDIQFSACKMRLKRARDKLKKEYETQK